MADEVAKIDGNSRASMLGVTDDVFQELRRLRVDPSTGRLLVDATGGGGGGDVTGPASSTDNAAARFDSTTGKILLNSGVIISDSNSVTLTSADSVDGTARLNLSTYERAVNPTHYGEVARLDWNEFDAKPAIAFRDNATSPGTPVSKAWYLCHDYLLYTDAAFTKSFLDAAVNTTTERITITAHGFSNGDNVKLWNQGGALPTGIAPLFNYFVKAIDANTVELYRQVGLTTLIDLGVAAGGGTHFIADITLGNNPHRHANIEVSDSAGAIQTRLEVLYDMDTSLVRIVSANLVVTDANKLYMVGANASNKEIRYGLDTSDVYTRWSVRMDNTTESGANAGSDFRIVPFTDAGVAGTSSLIITRSSNLATFAGSITSTGTTILLDSSGTATFAIDRGATTNFASMVYRTAGTDEWTTGLRNDSTNNYYLRDNINSVNVLTVAQGASPAVTAAGVWTFSNDVLVPDSAYGVGWNGSLAVPTRNAVYDKIETIVAGADFATLTVGASGADFTTIQAALDAIGSDGGTIWLLDSAYSISTGLLIKGSGVEIIGKGGGTRIFCDGAVVTTLIKANSTTFQRFALRNVWLDQTNATVQGIAIDMSNMSLAIYENVRILSFGTAIRGNDTANNTFYNTFKNVKIFECNNGIDLTSTNPINDNSWYDVRISLKAGGAGTGLKMTNAQGNSFYNLNVEPATGAGITGISLTTANVLDTQFYNLYAENNATNVSIGAGVIRTTFIGGTNTLATTTNLSDAGSQTSFFNQRLGSALQNQFAPFVAKDGSNASAIAGSFVNNTSFAHTGSTLVKMELLNATDSSPVLTLANAGSGNYITADAVFSVAKSGVVTVTSAAQDQIALAGGSGGLSGIVVTAASTTLLLTGNRAASDGTNVDVIVESQLTRTTGSIFQVRNNGSDRLGVNFFGGVTMDQAIVNGGTRSSLTINPANHSASTTTQEVINVQVTTYNRQWAPGTVALNREIRFGQATYLAVGASSFTSVVGLELSAPTASTNASFVANAGINYTGAVNMGASVAGSKYQGINLAAQTITFTGTTGITSTVGAASIKLNQLTITDASAMTMDAAAAIYIAAAPVAAGSAVITNAYSIWSDAGNVRIDDNLILGAAAAGATAAGGVLALSNTATAPSASANLAHLYSVDVAASAVLGIYQETAPAVGGAVASTHKWQVVINGTAYFVLLSNV